MNVTKVIAGNDHGGLDLKLNIQTFLEARGVDVIDVGSHHGDIVRYPYFAAKVCKAVVNGECERGILICSTGIGMSIIANKYPGIRAALVTDSYMAKMTRKHNDSNVLCLGGKITGVHTALDIVQTWMCTEYEGGRHDISLGLIREAEDVQLTGRLWTAPSA